MANVKMEASVSANFLEVLHLAQALYLARGITQSISQRHKNAPFRSGPRPARVHLCGDKPSSVNRMPHPNLAALVKKTANHLRQIHSGNSSKKSRKRGAIATTNKINEVRRFSNLHPNNTTSLEKESA
jgi:hypothetical protein